MVITCFGMPLAAALAQTDYEKNLQIRLGYQDGEYTVTSQEIAFGKSPNLAILSGPVKGIITDNKGSELTVFYLPYPGIATGDLVISPSGTDFAPYTEHRASGELSIILPVSHDMQTLSLYDTRTGMLLVSLDVQPAFKTFCLDYPHDPDCTTREAARTTTRAAPDTQKILVLVFFVSIIAAGLIFYLTTRRKEKKELPAARQTVLIVDDSPDILDIVPYALTKEGYTCITASSGEECLTILAAQKPDVILLDVVMGPLDGWSTLRQIKKNPDTKTIPVLMLTANHLSAQEARQYHICIEDYIRKPFHEEDLSAAIKQILARKKVFRESLAMARVAGVDREKFCQLAALSTRVAADKKIISILEKPDEELLMAGTPDREIREVISELLQNTQSKELQMEELKREIRLAFTRKGFIPPSW